ncbi:MAG: tetratricopeptide repeat protein [Fuerstiella sp.]|nr:tetratricopeptide repeat protein [Fuerstiella sp.]MCP4505867.1 tetratricopeptide repeat protein [Fuerstiella sp.]
MDKAPYILKTILASAVVVAVAAQSLFAVDIVTRRNDNTQLRGEIISMRQDQIVLKRTNGEEISISVSNLKNVRFDKEPLELSPARSNERSGALDVALTRYKEVQSEYTGGDKRLKTDLEFLIARVVGKQALTDPSRADAANKALEEFRSTNKDNFRYLEATLLQASIHALNGETDAGKLLLDEVQASGVKGYQLQAGVDKGRLLLLADDTAGALQSFDDVIQKSKGDESATGAMYDGLLGRAMCLKQQSSLDESIKTLDEVIDKAPPAETRTLAEAWVRKGDCLRQKNQGKAALMAYLHVDVLYSGEPAQHAEALLRLSRLWGPSGHQDRAVDASARLLERYPNSQWAGQSGG